MDFELVKDIVHRVFPAGSSLTQDVEQLHPIARYFIIPGRAQVRWIIPVESAYGLSVLSSWRPYSLLSLVKWRTLLVAYSSGQMARIPGVRTIGIACAESADWGRFGWRHSYAPIPVIYVGTPGTAQKAVVTLVDPRKRVATAVAKVPLTEQAGTKILHEAHILQLLHTRATGLAPHVVHVNATSSIVVQEFVTGKPSGRKLSRAHIDWLDCIPDTSDEINMRDEQLRWREGIMNAYYADKKNIDTLNRLIDTLCYPRIMPATWVHGDFTPWNLKYTRQGGLLAIDWEDAQPAGRPYTDVLHFYYMQAYLFRQGGDIFRYLERYEQASRNTKKYLFDRRCRKYLVLAYLIDAWIRQVGEPNGAHAGYIMNQITRISD